jgi:hypothetical protein
VEEPLVPPPLPRCAIATLGANAMKQVSASVKAKAMHNRQTLTEAGRSPKSLVACHLGLLSRSAFPTTSRLRLAADMYAMPTT